MEVGTASEATEVETGKVLMDDSLENDKHGSGSEKWSGYVSGYGDGDVVGDGYGGGYGGGDGDWDGNGCGDGYEESGDG